MARSRLAVLLAALALLAPASAFAQSAGDEQYADPFGDGQGQSNNQGSTPSSPPPTTTAQAPPAAAQLPRTGGDPITPAVAGFWLLLGGVALRARVRRP